VREEQQRLGADESFEANKKREAAVANKAIAAFRSI
jgi:hypothetical protein